MIFIILYCIFILWSAPSPHTQHVPSLFSRFLGLLDAAAKEHEKCRADCEQLQAQIDTSGFQDKTYENIRCVWELQGIHDV